MPEKPSNPKVCKHKDKCRLVYSGQMSTCMAWERVYDGFGNPVGGGDPNTHSSRVRCDACGGRWWSATTRDETTWTPDAP